jgi:hypothetical protein
MSIYISSQQYTMILTCKVNPFLVAIWLRSMLPRASSRLNQMSSALVFLFLRSLAENGILAAINVEILSISLDM